jgi:hypothetical protein
VANDSAPVDWSLPFLEPTRRASFFFFAQLSRPSGRAQGVLRMTPDALGTSKADLMRLRSPARPRAFTKAADF